MGVRDRLVSSPRLQPLAHTRHIARLEEEEAVPLSFDAAFEQTRCNFRVTDDDAPPAPARARAPVSLPFNALSRAWAFRGSLRDLGAGWLQGSEYFGVDAACWMHATLLPRALDLAVHSTPLAATTAILSLGTDGCGFALGRDSRSLRHLVEASKRRTTRTWRSSVRSGLLGVWQPNDKTPERL
ncbi:hypothetical protein LY76DRAFT_397249 [Colletotrichum caudatum]|nr:hypothetical protein LY76DRAFT_397249 [Colletotrichum caudatum]